MATDGVGETGSPRGEMFGRAPTASLLAELQQLTVESTIEQIRDLLTVFRSNRPTHDDVTMVLVEFMQGNTTLVHAG
jgi:serine phosphatase RsbU (regulator of sigma subunit)